MNVLSACEVTNSPHPLAELRIDRLHRQTILAEPGHLPRCVEQAGHGLAQIKITGPDLVRDSETRRKCKHHQKDERVRKALHCGAVAAVSTRT